jgi:hypothetical protein
MKRRKPIEKCHQCGCDLTLDNRYPSDEKRNIRMCKACHTVKGREWRLKNPEKYQACQTNFKVNHPERINAFAHNYRLRIRDETVAAYGGKCAICGVNDVDVLDVDHIDNTGNEHRHEGKYGHRLRMFLRKNGYPTDNYQLLCKNCNWKKHILDMRSKNPFWGD